MDGVNVGATTDPMKPVAGPSDDALDFDDPSQASTAVKEKPRGKRQRREKDGDAKSSKQEKKTRESESEESAPARRNRQQQRRPQRSQQRRGKQEESLADPDDGESPEDAYERVARRMSDRAGSRRDTVRDEDDARDGRRVDRERSRSNREDTRREREERIREREDRHARSRNGDGRREEDYVRGERRRSREDERDNRRDDRDSDFEYEDELDDERDTRREARSRRRDDDERDDRREDRRERRRDDRDDDGEDRITNAMLRQAMDEYGMTKGEALDYETASELESAFTKIDRQIAKIGQRERERLASEREQTQEKGGKKDGQDEGRSAAASPHGQNADGKSGADKPQQGEPRFKPFDLKQLSGDEWDGWSPGTKTVVENIGKFAVDNLNALDAENRELKSQVEWMMQKHREESVRRWANDMDGFFDEIADEYGDIFGEGRLDEMDPDSDEAKNRTDFENEMKSLILGKRSQGGDISMKDAQRKTLRLFAKTFEKLEETIRADAARKAGRRRRMSLNPPSNRGRGREMSPDDAAADFADNYYRDHGYAVDRRADYDDDFEDGV